MHGGSVKGARKRFPDAPEPFLDLSTGINPHPFPLPTLPAESLERLPEPGDIERLLGIAAGRYGAPSVAHILAAPGTQILLPMVAGLVKHGVARVLGPTYVEHLRCAAIAGHEVREARSLDELGSADLMIVVNPNNPDGHVIPREDLLRLARVAQRRHGLLVVDEAFMDVGPERASLADEVERPGLLVLRSFGKFHGLAGVRLGFALAHPDTVSRLRSLLGPWAVSGPALIAGTIALDDDTWATQMRVRLEKEAVLMDAVLKQGGLTVLGGTSLFRLARGVPGTFEQLGRLGILVRHFADRADLFRFGLPPNPIALIRLASALAARPS